MTFHVLWLVLCLVKLHGGCQLGARGYLWLVISFKAHRAIHLSRTADVQTIPLGFYTSADFSGETGVFGKNRQIAAQLPIQAQTLGEDGDTSADFRGLIDVYNLIEGENVAGDLTGDGNVVGAGANVSVHMPVDVEGLCEGDHVALHGAIHDRILGKHVNVALHSAID